MPSGDNLPLTTMTENAQFKLRSELGASKYTI